MSDGVIILIITAVPFIGSFFAACLPTNARNAAAWLAGTIALIGLIATLFLTSAVNTGGVIRYEVEWLPMLGMNFVLRMDGFAWMFSVLVCGIGALVVLYSRYYMSEEDPVPRFFSFLLAFMGSMLGIVLSGNLIQIAFFWETTSLFSFLLIGYWHHNPVARDGARMALTITVMGGLCLLVGLLIVGYIVGSYDLDAVLSAGDAIRNHKLYLPALLLILMGALTKSAQFPFHFWLPHAMAAPTPVSAFLHSATMVKAGVFLLARLWPVMSGTDEWFWIVSTAGLSTLLFGAFAAIFQQDLKGLLAYSTISHLGLITLLLGLGTPLAAVAAVFHIMNHATFKASLFMAAGVIDHETGTRDIRRLSGLIRSMPITAALAMVASAAMAGVPLLNGFLSKEMFFAEIIETQTDSVLDRILPYAATLAGMFGVVYSLRFIHGAFFGPDPVDLPRTPHEPPRWMRRPIELLVLACLIVGIVPGYSIGPYLAMAVHSILGAATPVYSLSIWHGFNLPLLMSTIALAGGVLMYLALRRYLESGVEGPPLIRNLEGQRIFERVLVALSWRGARTLERILGTRRLQPQLVLIVSLAFIAASLPLWHGAFRPARLSLAGVDIPFLMIWIVGCVCAVGTAYAAKFHRLAALALMSGAGLIVCVTFVWLSAPDLAITQLLVEIVTTVLLLLGLRWLPKRLRDVPSDDPLAPLPHWHRARDLSLCVAAGAGMALVAYAVMIRPPTDTIARHFLEKSYEDAGGTNVVNVLLVDFRGFDTLGEITVLGIVALSVFALLRRFRPAPDSIDRPEQQRLQESFEEQELGRQAGDLVADYMMIPRLIMHWLFPVVCVLAAYIFLRGHDLPGGGFAAGIAMSIAFIMQYMAGGARWVEARLRILPVRWIGFGLICAVLTGAGAWVFGFPFLTSHFRYLDVPAIGDVPLASALMFDLGVFLLVVGATVLMLVALAHQSIRGRRATRPADSPIAEDV